jgi:hypothetical protein
VSHCGWSRELYELFFFFFFSYFSFHFNFLFYLNLSCLMSLIIYINEYEMMFGYGWWLERIFRWHLSEFDLRDD